MININKMSLIEYCLCIFITFKLHIYIFTIKLNGSEILIKKNQRTIGPENAHLKPDPGVLSHHEMTLTLNTHTPLLNL